MHYNFAHAWRIDKGGLVLYVTGKEGIRVHMLELLLIAVGLSMDAFAVSICTGLTMQKATLQKAALVGLYFGGFQAAMPLIGFLLGSQFAQYIQAFDHWIAFVLLGVIGGKMIAGSLKQMRGREGDCPAGETPKAQEASLAPKSMLPLAVATSIDALAVGVTFAFLEVDIAPAVSFIGVITFAFSFVGVKIGSAFGAKVQSKAELMGGVILVLMGVKILLEHLGVVG